jgi:phosphoribosyl-AMP cyclohydrolase
MKNEGINFKKSGGFIPVIVQENKNNQIYMLGYMNREAFYKTMETGWLYFWSRSRKKLWMKGERSGNKLKLKRILVDCDKDSLLAKVELIGKNVCHTGMKSCFYQQL